MFLFGCRPGPGYQTNEVYADFMMFGLLHLAATMFITKDKRSDPRGGFFYRALSPAGLSGILDAVEEALEHPVGRTTLRQYVRHKRNKLATHGDLSFYSLPSEVQDITFDETSLAQHSEAWEALEFAVQELLEALVVRRENSDH